MTPRPTGRPGERITIGSDTRSVHGWARHAGISWRRMRALRAEGHTVAEIVAMEHPPRVRRRPRAQTRLRGLYGVQLRIAERVRDCERALARLRDEVARVESMEARWAERERAA